MIKKFKLIKRAKYISSELSKLGFYNIYEYFKILLGFEIDETVKPQKIRHTLEKLGPSFIKLGQVLSTRPDILPENVIVELTKLQDKAPEVEFEKIEEILNKNYKNYKNIFIYINPQPVASASISQVHEGFLKTGKKVAIKVKRPDIDKIIQLDIELFEWIFSFLEKHFKTAKEFNLKAIINEYKRTIKKELNFEIEAHYIDIFRKNFENNETFYIPKRYEIYCTKDVLVLEFIEGIKISEIEKLKEKNYSLKKIAENLTDAYFKMVFEDGIYHADPHPGNLFVMEDGKIACLDFGMVGRLPTIYKKLLYEHIYAVLNFDIILAMNFYEGLEMITPETDINKLENDVLDFLEKYHNKKLEEINLKEMVLDIINNIVR
jgi:ubiquinone biosynthesis protein